MRRSARRVRSWKEDRRLGSIMFFEDGQVNWGLEDMLR
jgi:hypothetical protein